MNQEKVVELCQRMTKLMENPQHGLATWNIMCQDVAEALRAEFAPAPPTARELLTDVVDKMAAMWLRTNHQLLRGLLEQHRSVLASGRLPALDELRLWALADERANGAP